MLTGGGKGVFLQPAMQRRHEQHELTRNYRWLSSPDEAVQQCGASLVTISERQLYLNGLRAAVALHRAMNVQLGTLSSAQHACLRNSPAQDSYGDPCLQGPLVRIGPALRFAVSFPEPARL